jgi:hypothetical protein
MVVRKSACGLVLLAVLGAAQASCVGTLDPPGAARPAGEGSDDGPTGRAAVGDEDASPQGIGTRAFALCASGGREVPAPRLLRLLTRREYKNTIRELLYVQEPDLTSLPLEPRVRGFDNNTRASVVTSRHADAFLTVAEAQVERALREQKGRLITCPPSAPTCTRDFIEKFGLRAFRRPLTTDEIARYGALFAAELTQNDFERGVRLVMTSMLVSPHFLYRSEVGQATSDGTFALTPYEVASALSYLYWGSMPDQALLDAAGQGKLATRAEREAQARRLLADPRAEEQLAEFSLQWLGTDSVMSSFKDKQIYPSFSDGVRTAMLEEQRRFVSDVALARDGTFRDLFAADHVFVNGELARFYGLTPQGDAFQRLPAGASERGGLLGLGAVLAAHAHSNESSPIRRGLFVRDRLLCQDLPPPPPSLDTTPPGLDPKLTTRARFAQHTADAACRGCHQYIDGVGFGLEGFDGVGQRRTQENGLPIDTSGELRGRESLGESRIEPFAGPRQLGALIADSATAHGCLTLQFFRYARGYVEAESDACALAKLKQQFEQNDLTLKDLLVNVVLLDSFTLRRGQ